MHSDRKKEHLLKLSTLGIPGNVSTPSTPGTLSPYGSGPGVLDRFRAMMREKRNERKVTLSGSSTGQQILETLEDRTRPGPQTVHPETTTLPDSKKTKKPNLVLIQKPADDDGLHEETLISPHEATYINWNDLKEKHGFPGQKLAAANCVQIWGALEHELDERLANRPSKPEGTVSEPAARPAAEIPEFLKEKPAPMFPAAPEKSEKGFLSRVFQRATAAVSATAKNALKTTTTALGRGYTTLQERDEARQKILSAFTDVGIGALSAKLGGLTAATVLGAGAMPALGLMAGTALATGVVRLGLECARDYHLKPQIGWRGILKKNFKRAALGAGFGLIGAGLVEAVDHVREMMSAPAAPHVPFPGQDVKGIIPMDSPLQTPAASAPVIEAPIEAAPVAAPEPAAPPTHKAVQPSKIRPVWIEAQTPTPTVPEVTTAPATVEPSAPAAEIAAPESVAEIPVEAPPVIEPETSAVAEPEVPAFDALADTPAVEPAVPAEVAPTAEAPTAPSVVESTAEPAVMEPEALPATEAQTGTGSGETETGSQTGDSAATEGAPDIALESCRAVDRLDGDGYLLECDKGALLKGKDPIKVSLMTLSM